MIPEEAIEAAAKGLAVHRWPTAIRVWDSFGQGTKDDFRNQARAALDAALPYLSEPTRHQSPTDWPDIPRRPK